MNDEIKEIIELINTKYEDYYIDDFLSGEDVKKLVDYITNLQQTCDDNVREYEKLLKMYNDNVSKYEELIEKYYKLQRENEKMSKRFRNCRKIKDNYKSRCEKAIEYLYDFNLANSIILERSYADLLNILQGESNE